MDNTTIQITSIYIGDSKSKDFKLVLDGIEIKIPVDSDLFAHFQNQFSRPNPSPAQKKKYATLVGLMRAAYLARKAA